MGAGPSPDYDFFGQRKDGGKKPPRQQRALTSLTGDDAPAGDPFVRGGRVSAPPTNPPPVFERPEPPPGDVRPWSRPVGGPAGGTGAATDEAPAWYSSAPATAAAAGGATTGGGATVTAPARPVPAYTAFTPKPRSAADDAPAPAGPRLAHDGSGLAHDGSGPDGTWRPPAHWQAPDLSDLLPADLALGRPARPGPRRASVAATLLVTLVAAATLATLVGIPRYLSYRDRQTWETTQVTIPAKAAGLPRITSASVTAKARTAGSSLLTPGTGQMITDVAVYGRKNVPQVVAVVGRPQHPLTSQERAVVVEAYSKAVGDHDVVLSARDPGPLGGEFLCGVREGRTTMCLSVDSGAVLSITVTRTGPTAIKTATQVRQALETRT